MTTPAPMPWHHEVSRLSLFISLPQIIASPVIVGITHFVGGNNVLFELKEILDFFLISFPLTLSIAILFVIIEKGNFNLFYLVAVVAGAALLSNLLHGLVEEIPSVGIKNQFNETFGPNNTEGGNSAAVHFVIKIFGVYWKTFGPILFIQSCCIGIYAGYRYIKIEERRKAKK